ncbi:uncharacterized protein ARMOST_17768 [Armillaria ostoyae]|uniref:Uncharacterized protein n=1 Tax=Armillaria ostoyae TaxID=47428 RepID=A0A284RZX1_ARMOS|nr:uncharacterized protein ARMOST_17768 [Armillaria ostoyae]
MDMVIPGNLNPDQDDNTWAQNIVAALASGVTDDSAHGFVSGKDFVMKESSAHLTLPLPPATSSPAAKKLAKRAVPTWISTCHKDLLSSKAVKPSPAVNPKAALALLKGKAPTVLLPVPPIGPGPSIPPVNAATIYGGVMGMNVAGAKEDIADTITRLDHNQLRLGATIIDLKDALSATDSNAAIGDNALISQMSDVRKYISEVHTAQLSVPDAPTSEDFHTLEKAITTFIQSTEGHFTSFQSVLNAITDRLTFSAPAVTLCTSSIGCAPIGLL